MANGTLSELEGLVSLLVGELHAGPASPWAPVLRTLPPVEWVRRAVAIGCNAVLVEVKTCHYLSAFGEVDMCACRLNYQILKALQQALSCLLSREDLEYPSTVKRLCPAWWTL